MKSVWSLLASIALILGCAGAIQAGEPSPSTLPDLGIFTPAGDHAPMTLVNEGMAAMNKAAVCQPGTFQYYCKDFTSGPANGRCGANTWRYSQCQQYKNSAGKWYIQNCTALQEVCTPPGGAECIHCS